MVDDEFFDPDDLSHGLGLTAYELDQEGLAISVSGLPRDEPGDFEGLRVVDDDTLGRSLGLSNPDPDELDAAREAALVRARSRVRKPADRREPDARVRGVPEPDPDDERSGAEGASRRGADHSGDGGDESARIRAYLVDPKNTQVQRSLRNQAGTNEPVKRRRKELPPFEGAKFGFEVTDMRVLPTGGWRLVVNTPAEDRDEVFKLSLTQGILLEVSVSLVEGVIT